jgi:hypothetical protein
MDLPRRVDDLQQKVENLSVSFGILNLKMNQSLPESKKMDKHKQSMNQNV